MAERRLAVVGAGAAGMFAAIHAARLGCSVTVLEATRRPLRKVLASGGGRCNVLHVPLPSVRDLTKNYPRGARELVGPFTSKWTQHDTYEWFEREGVELKVEKDGRCFPITDSSSTVADALQDAAAASGVEVVLGAKVTTIAPAESSTHASWTVEYSQRRRRRTGLNEEDCGVLNCDAVMLATGSAPVGHALAADLGHDMVPARPSLFSFRLARGHVLEGLQGLTLPDVELSFDASNEPRKKTKKKGTLVVQRGPMLVTHRGVSGPAALRLSSYAAVPLSDCGYRGVLRVAVLPGLSKSQAADVIRRHVVQHGNRGYVSGGANKPFPDFSKMRNDGAVVPRRLWQAIVRVATEGRNGGEGAEQVRWADLRKSEEGRLCDLLSGGLQLPFDGKDTNKEEFVTCGGVDLRGVDLRRMESKLHPGLFFGGEVLDIDGVTGGFNFQSCWTTGHIAAAAAAAAAGRSSVEKQNFC